MQQINDVALYIPLVQRSRKVFATKDDFVRYTTNGTVKRRKNGSKPQKVQKSKL
jgi:hypothetical protein